MKKVNLLFIEIITATVLVALWTLSAGGKLVDLPHFKGQLGKQVFSKDFVAFLYYGIPLAELLAAQLLAWRRTRLAGFGLSTLLMGSFTSYIALVLAGYYARVPCACISVIKGMGFPSHLYFNLFFLAVAITGMIFTLKERRRRYEH